MLRVAPEAAETKNAPVDAVKSIPPEHADTIRSKNLVIAAFWAVAICLGLPIWWWTTSIHRASLPTKEMLNWSDGKTCQLEIPLQIFLEQSDLTDTALSSVRTNLEQSLMTEKSSGIDQLQWKLISSHDSANRANDEEHALSVTFKTRPAISTPTASLIPQSTVLEVLYDPRLLKQDDYLKTIGGTLAKKLQDIFAEEQSSIAQLLSSNLGQSNQEQSQSRLGQDVEDSRELGKRIAVKRARSLKYAPTYHISISLFTPGAVPTSWDIEDAVYEYLTPLLNSYSISNFTVDTQLQLYAPFSPTVKEPEFDGAKQQWTVREEDLGSFINAAEWPLSPHIGDGPTINFILYVPEESLRPLVVKDSGATSWVVPQWGGISIFNPTGPLINHLNKDKLRPAMLTFAHQLLSLLGVAESPSSLPLQVQSLTRIHALGQIISASSTLGALARLSESLSTIPIPEEVLLRVQRGLDHLEQSCLSLRSGKSRQALEHARIAAAEAEKAFFEKDMVSQVYFPDEHKVAVYLPLLGPMGVTLLTSLFREVRRRRAALKGL